MRRPRARALLAAAAAVAAAAPVAAGPPSAVAQHDHGAPSPIAATVPVDVGFAAFAPAHVDVLAGATVRWTNVSARAHTVTAPDGSWGSGRIGVDGSYSHRFDAVGTVPYVCTLHPGMRGEVGVHEVLLDAPREQAAPGRPFPLRGRSSLPAGTDVAIEADAGAGFVPVARAAVAPDGTFAADVAPESTARWRAVAGAGPSPPVLLDVVGRKVSLVRRGDVLTTLVSPPAPGMTVVLQLRLRERFGWWPVRRARLDGRSRARFVVRRRAGHVPARALLTLRDGATELARSPTVRLGG